MAEDWRGFGVPGWGVKRVDLWRFLDCCPMGMHEFGRALNQEAAAVGGARVLLGYSMGGRLALHALLRDHTWDAAVVVSAHPGLEDAGKRAARREMDAGWAAMALKKPWQGFLHAWNGQQVLAAGERGSCATGLVMADRRSLEPRRASVARSFIDWSLGAQEPLLERLREVGCPSLWVAGERDGKFRGLAEEASRRVAGAGFRAGVGRPCSGCWIAPGAAHRVPWESAEFPTRVAEFLERAIF